MKKNYHLTNTGELSRKDNTVVFESDQQNKKDYIPIENVDAIYAHKEIRFNTKLYQLLDKHTVELHLFSWSGKYVGGYFPTKSAISGNTIVEQVNAYQDSEQRRMIARKIVSASIHNMRRNLKYYNSKSYDLNAEIKEIENINKKLSFGDKPVDKIMGYEGECREIYYSCLSKIIPDEFEFDTREYNPPSDEFNALLSFGNSLLYATVSSAIQSTALDPTISFLHSPGSRRHSLSLDIADIFKPVFIDRMILRLVNRKQIQIDDFDRDWMLTEQARKNVLAEYEELLENTIEHPTLDRHVSYQYLIKLDVLNLKKHILTGEEYEPFERW